MNTRLYSSLYNGDGNMVVETIGLTTTLYIGNIYEKKDQNGTVTQKKHYYAGSLRVAVSTKVEAGSWDVNFLLSDHLGSTSITTDASGSRIADLRFKPWGGLRYGWGTQITDYTFNGHLSKVDHFGLIYFKARWFDPSLGRFAQADTIIPGTQSPAAWDRYSFSFNNPINLNDPSGHNPCYGINDPIVQQECMEGYETDPQGIVETIPTSEVYIIVTYVSGDVGVSVAVIVETNTVLSHNHHLLEDMTQSDIQNVVLADNQEGNNPIISAESGEFLMLGGDIIGGGLSVFVFDENFAVSSDIALLGNANNLASTDQMLQSASRGVDPGLYSTRVVDVGTVIDINGSEYTRIVVYPDKTIRGDSGSPLYGIDGRVYGINNYSTPGSTTGFYGGITDANLIYSVITDITEINQIMR